MSGDYSRWSFDPLRHFGAVLMQQGRVHTDADFNEWVSITLRRLQAGSLDTLGAAVVPRETPQGFQVVASGGGLTIGRGRMYVDGLLVENHGEPPAEWDPRLAELRGTAPTPYDAQPHLPEAPPLPGSAGPHLVYLRAWQRERTSIEDPSLVEPALGVDTTARLQTAWQVRVLPDVGDAVTCATPLEDVPGFEEAEPTAAGRLSTATADVPGEPDPCRVPPSGDYKGLENQLYRVEIHDGGGLGAGGATFKWSRDNATVATRITELPVLDRIVVESVGRDDVLRFSDGDWVEITDDFRELAGLPGELRRIQSGGGVDDATREIRLTEPLPAGAFPTDAQGRTTPGRNTRMTRWDQHGRVVDAAGAVVVDLDVAGAPGTIPVGDGTARVLLEHGIVVTLGLDPVGGRFRTGDFWVFAARTADASVEALDEAPPLGIHAHHAKLALITLPESETDCRSLWPPEGGEAACECSVCVTPESHASGALTIQAAIDQVKERGGTVCLGAGEYPLPGPVEIDGAESLRVRGHGLATVLLATRGGTAIDVRRSLGVTVEDLAVVTSPGDRAPEAIRFERSFDAVLRRCAVLSLTGDARGGSAVRLAGYVIGARVEDCVLAAETGITAGSEVDRDDRAVVTASLQVDSNWLWCTRRGIDFGPFAVHLAGTRITRNTLWGCKDAGVMDEGANAAGPYEIAGNALRVDGSGILAGVDGLRIADNDLRGGEGDGIGLIRGLDAGGLDHCQVLANRVSRFRGAGIAIRARVNSAMVKHNVVTGTGAVGIDAGDDGNVGILVVENNQLRDVADAAAERGGDYLAGMRFVAVTELDVAGNVVDGAATVARLADGSAGLLAVAVASARIEGNRLIAIGPAERSVNRTSAIEIAAPFDAVTIAGNTLRRRRPGARELPPAQWLGLLVGDGRRLPESDERRFVTLGDLALVRPGRRTVLLTATTAHAFADAEPGDVSARGNEIDPNQSIDRPALIVGARFCELSQNRIHPTLGRLVPSMVAARRAVACANDLRGLREQEVLEIFVHEKTAAVLGNLHTGPITINDSPLGNAGDPWAPLNVQSVT